MINKKLIIGWLLCLLAALHSSMAYGQYFIKGRVIDAVSGRGIANGSVFISNTSIGTVSDSSGYFMLHNVPAGNNNLIVSCVGFEKHVFSFRYEQLPLLLQIKLHIKARELQEVVLEPYETGGYEKWKYIFFPEFIGTNDNGAECKILNPDVLQFRHYNKSSRLIAWADEPVIIENKALGYIIYYMLDLFESDQVKRTTYFNGYPLFKEMETDKPQKKERWQKARKEAYWGSVMHFMRCVYNNSLLKEGFEVRAIRRVQNEEKRRVANIYKSSIVVEVTEPANGRPLTKNYKFRNEPKGIPKDSLLYYRKIIVQNDSVELAGKQLLSADSLIVAVESNAKVSFFNNSLFITNKMKTVDGKLDDSWSSLILMPGKEIRIEQNGSYYDAKDIIAGGAWALNERVSNMLPWDY
jgi:CarboxypepD_reg-like domain